MVGDPCDEHDTKPGWNDDGGYEPRWHFVLDFSDFGDSNDRPRQPPGAIISGYAKQELKLPTLCEGINVPLRLRLID
jgi:hypothetical protein